MNPAALIARIRTLHALGFLEDFELTEEGAAYLRVLLLAEKEGFCIETQSLDLVIFHSVFNPESSTPVLTDGFSVHIEESSPASVSLN